MRKWILVCIILLLIAACARPPSLKAKNVSKVVKNDTPTVQKDSALLNVSDIIAQIENQTLSGQENVSAEPSDELLIETPVEVKPDRVDVHLIKSAGGNKSEVTATFGGKTQSFTLAQSDRDAVIFEVSKKFVKPLKLVRSVTYFDGDAYLRPSERESFSEALASDEDEKIDEQTIPIFIEKDDGFIRGVGCSLERGILRIKLQNDGEQDFPLYRDVRPRIKGALVVTLNTRVLAGIYCGGKDILKAGSSLDCIKSNTLFVRTRQKVGINENATDVPKVKDFLVAYYPGYFEKVEFDCAPGIKLLPKVNITVNISANSTRNASTNASSV
ncbi:hypothetical protein HY641_02185 [Candidatus Woesearchaeota archaeon]|nr:hypothetical protein [Candidatus Woesearchaeota archaeon]